MLRKSPSSRPMTKTKSVMLHDKIGSLKAMEVPHRHVRCRRRHAPKLEHASRQPLRALCIPLRPKVETDCRFKQVDHDYFAHALDDMAEESRERYEQERKQKFPLRIEVYTGWQPAASMHAPCGNASVIARVPMHI